MDEYHDPNMDVRKGHFVFPVFVRNEMLHYATNK